MFSALVHTDFLLSYPAQFSSFTYKHIMKVKVLVTQLCLTLCNPSDCSPPGSSVHEILRARILEWLPFLTQGLSNPGLLHCKQILYQLSCLGNPSIIWIFWIKSFHWRIEVGLKIRINTVLSSCPFHLNLLCSTTANTYFMYVIT